MGRSVFICKVPDRATMKKATEAVLRHNSSEMKPLGRFYTVAEFEELDPMRAEVVRGLQSGGTELGLGCMEAWTRGEDIHTEACLVRFRDSDWLEVVNSGGGACTTKWLKDNYPELGWIGTEGKPVGFKQAPMTKHGRPLELLATFAEAQD